MQQHGLTIIVPVSSGREGDLRTLLNAIGTDVDGNDYINFYKLSTVHFMRWVILPAQEIRGKPIGVQLVLSTNFDGNPEAHLAELIAVAPKGIAAIYDCCQGFPIKGDAKSKLAFFMAHSVKNAAFYGGTVGRSVGQIQAEKRLYEGIQNHLQQSNPSQNWSETAPEKLRKQLTETLQAKSDFAWTRTAYQAPFLQRYGRVVLASVLGLALVLTTALLFWQPKLTAIAFAVLALIPMGWYLILRNKEGIDKRNFVPAARNVERIADLNAREDFRIQNQITHLVEIKEGMFRLWTLRFILGAINLLARTFYNRGNLAGIPSIHFARWAVIDGGRRLLFFSNFDGSWESYLGDFIDKAAIGLTGVWSNTVGFPPTEKLIFSGARNSGDFKAWVREKQLETQVWFSAYKTLSVQNINNNTQIRKGMLGEMNAEQSMAWLQKL